MCASTRSRPNKRAAVVFASGAKKAPVAAQPPTPADKKPAAVRRQDGARHGEPSYDEFVERWRLGMRVFCEFGALAPGFRRKVHTREQ